MTADEAAFVGALCYRFPVLMPLLQEHLDDYESLLPHVFMGDVTRWVVERFRADPSDDTLRHILDFLEAAFEDEQDRERELIAASFLENLPRSGQADAGLRELLGPALQDQLRQVE